MVSMTLTSFIALPAKQTFGSAIKVPIDIDGCVESTSVRCLYRIQFM